MINQRLRVEKFLATQVHLIKEWQQLKDFQKTLSFKEVGLYGVSPKWAVVSFVSLILTCGVELCLHSIIDVLINTPTRQLQGVHKALMNSLLLTDVLNGRNEVVRNKSKQLLTKFSPSTTIRLHFSPEDSCFPSILSS